ncbi:hypothetical protein IV203_025271 [Nitzschia inconspicua]|uniref:Uncharacterized protein n=1 Tax=Nitzschia inconspicua TaxID=303405 RepID=A0A9K3LHV5_9STRA|nr:hypothetical protein IV203_024724 [Nitzschia inconspicua]KAG7362387.1 hypothetical protein IV203_025271 [Nitzschia inconspicua]
MPFSKRKWSSLPTISEDELSSFGYNVSQHRSGANSCHSFSRRSPKPKQTKRKTLSVFQRECGNSSFPPSNPSQEITLSLLKDLKLSETRKKSLVASIHRQKPPISSIARTPDLKDSIMAPPHRISSNALIDPSYQLERSAHHLANPQKLLVNMKSEDRFASILLTPTPRSNKSNEGISSLSCARYKTMDSPRIPSRPASPVNFA